MQELADNLTHQLQNQENIIEPFTLKSNLKRTTVVNEHSRKTVKWPDAYGKEIAHVHEFEPSISEDEELEGVRNSCICTIQ
ncbi:uncharacterized protein LOC126669102 [Mercurialis annua]|uniref:uncharacterized protein LOC126669102 n=1 Tax=Mercurialis annua TaxID=3986 RepID=UPI0021608982|nr:uncharacterized protein LOC126669102 [Mercurialis annua]XP_055960541.1 uncharacterized protein LOC126669102 [Mercurialis annua]